MSTEDYSTKDYSTNFATMIMQIPETMYIFEVQKSCGYGEFVLIYKDMMVSEMIKVVATQFQDPSIHSLFFMNPEKHVVSITDPLTVRQLIEPMQLRTVYPGMENFVVYRVFITPSTHLTTNQTTAELATMTSCHENDRFICFSTSSSSSSSSES